MRCFCGVAVVAALAGWGCTKRNPAVCCTTASDCEAQGLPSESMCATGQTCVQNECVTPTSCQADSDCEAPTPLCVEQACGECRDDAQCGARVCDGETHVCRDCVNDSECSTGYCRPDTHDCAAGILTPKFLASVCDSPASADLSVALDTTITTADDAICTGGVVQQTDGASVCVIRKRAISIAASATLVVTGDRAVALVADEVVDIAGNLEASATGTSNGPGGGTRTSGGAPSPSDARGGGGAGFKTNGGAGGIVDVDGGAANGGAAIDAFAESTFFGGPRAAGGGGGGGAVMLIACRGTVNVSGRIAVNGGGGAGGKNASPYPEGGGGGGAGGNVILQGRNVVITGSFFANGGAGGSGKPNTTNTAVGVAGEDGPSASTCAAGGSTTGAAAGGNAGCAMSPPTDGRRFRLDPVPASLPSGGGGGGSVGFLQVYVPAGVTPTITPSAASPAFEPHGTIETH